MPLPTALAIENACFKQMKSLTLLFRASDPAEEPFVEVARSLERAFAVMRQLEELSLSLPLDVDDEKNDALLRDVDTVVWRLPALRKCVLESVVAVPLRNWPRLVAPKLHTLELFPAATQVHRAVALLCSCPCLSVIRMGRDGDTAAPSLLSTSVILLTRALRDGIWPNITHLELPGRQPATVLQALVRPRQKQRSLGIKVIDLVLDRDVPPRLVRRLLLACPRLVTLRLRGQPVGEELKDQPVGEELKDPAAGEDLEDQVADEELKDPAASEELKDDDDQTATEDVTATTGEHHWTTATATATPTPPSIMRTKRKASRRKPPKGAGAVPFMNQSSDTVSDAQCHQLLTLTLCIAEDALFTAFRFPRLRSLTLEGRSASLSSLDAVLRACPKLFYLTLNDQLLPLRQADTTHTSVQELIIDNVPHWDDATCLALLMALPRLTALCLRDMRLSALFLCKMSCLARQRNALQQLQRLTLFPSVYVDRETATESVLQDLVRALPALEELTLPKLANAKDAGRLERWRLRMEAAGKTKLRLLWFKGV